MEVAHDINQETRTRVITAANQLYEQLGRTNFPTVDAVRRQAKVDMNAASIVMKEWRRMQTATPLPVAVAIPERLRQAQDSALAALWGEAQEIANEALQAAQSAWDAERDDADILRAELSAAFEEQAGELSAACARIVELERTIQEVNNKADDTARQLEVMTTSKHAAENRATLAENRAEEIERRANDLKIELDRAHQEVDRTRIERDEAIKEASQVRQDTERQLLAADAKVSHAQESLAEAAIRIDALRDELATVKARAAAEIETHAEYRKNAAQETHRVAERLAKVQAERETALNESGQAREEVARLTGQLEVMRTQHKEVMQLLGEREKIAGKNQARNPK